LPFVQHLWSIVRESDDSALREVMIRAMAFSGDPIASEFVRGLILDPDLRPQEISYIGFHQTYYESNREAIWAWTQANYDAVVERVGKNNKGEIVGLFATFCSEEQAVAVDAFFADRVSNQDGSSRALASTLETIRLCSAFVDAHSQREISY
jgi:alanyl aminopeptidase